MNKTKTLLLLSSLLLISCGGEGASQSSSVDPTPEQSESTSAVPGPIDPVFIDAKVSPNPAPISESVKYTTYYFDGAKGNDSNSGLSKDAPKKSLIAASSLIRAVKEDTPTKILFKAGSVYEQGKLFVQQFKATEEAPLIVDVYDKTEENQYCKIIGKHDDNCIEVQASNVRLGGFELTAPDGFRGIHVTTTKRGAMKNIVIQNNWVHDVNFMLGEHKLPTDNSELDGTTVQSICPDERFSYSCGGIIFEANTPIAKGPSWYENVWIDNNKIERVNRTGIWMFSNWAQRPGIDWGTNPYYSDEIGWYPHKNVNVRGNGVHYSGGDGIIIGASVGGFVERNVCYHAQVLSRPNYYCAGIWLHSCKEFVMQFNEAAYTHTARDGQGFDIDIGNSDILFQYNYSHHNDGGGLLCCNTETKLPKYTIDGEMVFDEDGLPVILEVMAPWHDVTVKNNVFSDNDNGNLILSGTVDRVDFSNNTVIMGGEIANQKVMDTKDFYTGIPGTDWKFNNNIFYLRKPNTVRFEMAFSQEFEYENNVYYGFDKTIPEIMKDYGEDRYVEENPNFASDIADKGFDSVYHFIPNSPKMYEGGSDLEKMLRYDLNGNDVSKVRYYGAFGSNQRGNL